MSEVGTNLATVNPWSTEYPFIDRMKSSSNDWMVKGPGGIMPGDPSLEVNGYYQSWPTGATQLMVAVQMDPVSLPTTDRYVVTWTGNGTPAFLGANVVASGDHQLTINFTGTTGSDAWDEVVLCLNNIDSSDPIRDIHVVREDQVDLFNQGEIFTPDFLDKISQMNDVRFVDWDNANTNTVQNWSDRTTEADRSWASGGTNDGVPLEVMVKLCNEAHVDMWWNVPTQANDDYVRSALTYIHNNLDPSLTAHIEYSNEVWNWSFQQSHYAAAQADALWGKDANGDGVINPNDPAEHIADGNEQYYGYRSAQIASMANQIWGSAAEARLDTVISTQTAYEGLENSIFAGIGKANLGTVPQLFDSYAIAGYFGGGFTDASGTQAGLAQILAWASQGQAGVDAAFAQLEHGGSMIGDSIDALKSLYAYQANVAHQHNLNLVAYEAGSGLWAGNAISNGAQVEAFIQTLLADPRMVTLYQENLANFNAAGGNLFNAYNDTGNDWGTLQSMYGDTSARWDALVDAEDGQTGGVHLTASGSHGSALTGGTGRDWLVGGSGADTLTGNAGNDTLQGGSGNDKLDGGLSNDYLDGGTGNDQLTGGLGDDTYVVNSSKDKIVEAANAGYDTVYATGSSYTLSANVEALTRQGGGAFKGIANASDNLIIGGTGDDLLYGKDGNDVIQGGNGNDRLHGQAGNDQLLGGTGNDTYYIESSGDQVIENAGEGTDLVRSWLNTYVLPGNVENLTFEGTGAFNGYGNDLNNVIRGGDQGNTLIGGAGNDSLHGGAAGDWLDGGSGHNDLYGGGGNDGYEVDYAGTTIHEYAGGGTDTVIATVTFTLPNYVENLTMTGGTLIDGTGNALDNYMLGNLNNNHIDAKDGNDFVNGDAGNDILDGGNGNDTLQGSYGNDVLNGGAGNDVLDGGTDRDTMTGGDGNDTYAVDNAGDTVTELTNGGHDAVRSTISYTLTDNVEELHISGTATRGTGNALDNQIYDETSPSSAQITLDGGIGNDELHGGSNRAILLGGAGDDQLYGGGAADVITGGIGKDTMLGNGGADRFVFASGDSGSTAGTADEIGDFSHGQGDRIDLSALSQAAGTGLSFIGGSAFSGVAGQLQVVGGGTSYYASVDVDGDRHADLVVHVWTDGTALTASDFVL